MRAWLTASLIILALAALGTATQPAHACLHADDAYQGSVAESGQQALIFYDNGWEELILKVDYRFGGEAPPASLAWVIPVPSAPEEYGVVKAKVFEELFHLQAKARAEKYAGSRARTLGGGDDDLTFLSRVAVGEYQIQPIQGTGPDAGTALNVWLHQNGFGQVPVENMAWYLERGWTFLAIQADTAQAEKEGGLRPLRLGFASDRIVYPLKFSSHQGIFKATVYVITRRGLDVAVNQAALDSWGFSFGDPEAIEVGSSLRREAPELLRIWREVHGSKRIGFSRGVLNKIGSNYGVNRPENPLSDWPEDFSLVPPER